jgi:hypothetical protein
MWKAKTALSCSFGIEIIENSRFLPVWKGLSSAFL